MEDDRKAPKPNGGVATATPPEKTPVDKNQQNGEQASGGKPERAAASTDASPSAKAPASADASPSAKAAGDAPAGKTASAAEAPAAKAAPPAKAPASAEASPLERTPLAIWRRNHTGLSWSISASRRSTSATFDPFEEPLPLP